MGKIFDFVLNWVLNWGLIGNYVLPWEDPNMTAAKVALFGAGVIVLILAGYFLGSINFAIIISSTQYKQDIRDFGSNNAGMTNMMRTYGKKAAAFTFIGDVMKAVVACLLGHIILGQLGAYIAGLFCIVGHIFPIYYKFKGGKGVVTAGVTILMCNPVAFLIVILIFFIIVGFTRYISLGSVMGMLLYPLILDRVDRLILPMIDDTKGSVGGVFAIIMTALIVFKHWQNIKRLFKGTESKFSFKKSVKRPTEEKDTQK